MLPIETGALVIVDGACACVAVLALFGTPPGKLVEAFLLVPEAMARPEGTTAFPVLLVLPPPAILLQWEQPS